MSLDKIIKIKINGRNVDRYLNRMIKNKIYFINVDKISNDEVCVVLRYSDYLDLMKYKSILYKVSIVDKVGILKIKEKFDVNKILIFFVMLGLFFLYGLSNVVFGVNVIHQDSNIRELLYEELDKYGISKYSFKKGYRELEEIEDKILDDNKDRLEWLEIIIDGVFIKVRVEERVIKGEEYIYKYQDIVASKNAVINSVRAFSGEVLKEKGSYVKKGDVVISGGIIHPDNSLGYTMANGEVYGEVWYLVNIKYPFVYQESNLTGRKNKGISINFFDKEFNLFSKNIYKSFSRKNKVLLSDNLLDLEVVWEKRYELDIRDEVYTEELVESRAIDYIVDKMMLDNSSIKEVINIKVLSREVDYDGINFEFFVTTIENVGEVMLIQDGVVEELPG